MEMITITAEELEILVAISRSTEVLVYIQQRGLELAVTAIMFRSGNLITLNVDIDNGMGLDEATRLVLRLCDRVCIACTFDELDVVNSDAFKIRGGLKRSGIALRPGIDKLRSAVY